MRHFLIGIVATILMTPINSEAYTGSELLKYCAEAKKFAAGEQKYDAILASLCLGFVSGFHPVFDMYSYTVAQHKLGYSHACIPEEVTNEQLIRVLVAYLEANPANLHERDFVLVVRALSDAFPCGR